MSENSDRLTGQEITELVERLGQRPEVRVAQLEDQLTQVREVLQMCREERNTCMERIRELETTRQVEADYFHNELKELRGRIAKAREILKYFSGNDVIALQKALEQTLEGALEGE